MDEKKVSEYYTIIELLEDLPFKKVVLLMLGFYTLVLTVALSFMYWYLKR
jgi:hypothetical protein